MGRTLEGVEVETVDGSAIVAVVDTNVALDIFSMSDLFDTAERLGANAVDHPEAVFRRARVRESYILAIHFHATKARTYSLGREIFSILDRVVPAEEDAAPLHFVRVCAHFIKPQLLPDWLVSEPHPAVALRSNEADDHLIATASDLGVPLITNEGYNAAGIGDGDRRKMRARAKAKGVAVYTPREFTAGRLDEEALISGFLEDFVERAPAFIRTHPNPAVVADTMNVLHGYFRHVFYGETQGRAEPARVRVKANEGNG